MTNQIVSLSGGKDSTAMLLMMLERREKIHSVVFFDTGWEFPVMYDHILQVEQVTGLKVWTLHPRIPFEYRMLHRPVVGRDGTQKTGWGWPSNVRWCTRQKIRTIDFFCKPIEGAVQCIGYAADEDRTIPAEKDPEQVRLPLQEWGITESDALQYCIDKGFNWGGLYDYFSRVSCFCCPQKGPNELRVIRKYFPELWAEMLRMDKGQPDHTPGFKNGKSIHDFERRFAEEDRQMVMFKGVA